MKRLLVVPLFFGLAAVGCDNRTARFQVAMSAYANARYDEARIGLSALASSQHPGAQFRLGTMYAHGLGVERNPATARYWYERAAEQDEASAQYYLAKMHLQGDAGPKDPSAAFHWFERLAQRGYGPASYQLARMYQEGIGVTEDDGQASMWLARAAEQGYSPTPRPAATTADE